MKELEEAPSLTPERLVETIARMPDPEDVVKMTDEARRAGLKDVFIEYIRYLGGRITPKLNERFHIIPDERVYRAFDLAA